MSQDRVGNFTKYNFKEMLSETLKCIPYIPDSESEADAETSATIAAVAVGGKDGDHDGEETTKSLYVVQQGNLVISS